jgi:hypothetical protein
MNDHTLDAVSEAVREVVAGLPSQGAVTILVLGDPNALICSRLQDAGVEAQCCPLRQQPRLDGVHEQHTFILCDDVNDLLVLESDRVPPRHWDIVVAVAGWERFVETHRANSIDALVRWIRQHSTIAIFAGIRRQLAPTVNDLGPWILESSILEFPYLGEWRPKTSSAPVYDAPLLVVSDHYLYSSLGLIPANDLRSVRPTHHDHAPAVRTLIYDAKYIVKIGYGSSDYFDVNDVAAEADFLSRVDESTRADLGLPNLIASHTGRVVSQSIRNLIPGSASTPPGKSSQWIADSILRISQAYAARGLFHNDIRPWNLLWCDSHVTLIDFASTSRADQDASGLPQVLAMAGTVLACLGRSIPTTDRFADHVMELARAAGVLDAFPSGRLFGDPWSALVLVESLDVSTYDDQQFLWNFIEALGVDAMEGSSHGR